MKEKLSYEGMSNADLEKTRAELYEELRNARFGKILGNVTNVKLASNVRRQIARVNTILQQRKLGIE